MTDASPSAGGETPLCLWPPHCQRHRDYQIVVPAGAGKTGMTALAEPHPVRLQLPQQRSGQRQAPCHLDPAGGDGDGDRIEPGVAQHVEHRPADARRIDHQVSLARERPHQGSDPLNRLGIWQAQRQAF